MMIFSCSRLSLIANRSLAAQMSLKDRLTPLRPSERPDLWTVRNKRYAISDAFVAAHPGGRDAISLGQGRNCTELFESYHSLSDKPSAMLAKFYVEDAQPGDADYDDSWDWAPTLTPFYTELKASVRTYFESRNLSHKAKWSKLFIAVSLAVLCALVYFGGFVQGYWWAPFALPLLYWAGPACLLHDGSHFALSSYPAVNSALARLGSYHMDLFAWYHQHVVGHHSYTNILDRDPDLRAFEGVPPKYFYGHRLSPFAPYFQMYRSWLRSLFVTIPFTCVQPSVNQDANVWLRGHYDDTVAVTIRPSPIRVVFHFVGRVLLWTALFVVPFLRMHWAKAAFFAFWPAMSYGIQYYLFSQISHINEDCFHDEPTRDWAVHQTRTSLDWGVHHEIWQYASISLNMQTIHHLFPQIDTSHHMQLRPIVEAVARKHGVVMNYAATLWDAVGVHLKHIYALNCGGINEPTQVPPVIIKAKEE